MQTPTQGAIYRDFADTLVECVRSPDTFGVPTRIAENKQIEFEVVENGDTFTIPVDNFGRSYEYVADSRDDLDSIEA